MALEPDESDPAVKPALAETRRSAIAELLRDTGSVTVAELEERFGISAMTARRDLGDLVQRGIARRTHGGAVLPTMSAHEDSFARRVKTATEAKLALAAEAVGMLSPRETVFLDSSTSAYYVARRIVDEGMAVTIITNSIPIMEVVASTAGPNVDLIGVGGALRKLTSSYVGPFAVQTVLGHFADRAIFSVKGVTADGLLTDADQLEAEVKRTMLSHAQETMLLLDETKLETRGSSVVGNVADVSQVVAYGIDAVRAAILSAPGVELIALAA
jgi:DeoR/GlpR family transcriptional regulator of sugar metabolism